jgi:hypothetical protein
MTDTERGALIIKIARRLLRAGRARGWSDALRLAELEVGPAVDQWSQSPEQ